MYKKTLLMSSVFALLLGGSMPAQAIEKDGEGYYLLGSKADWKEFVALINGGTELDANAKLTADINLPTEGNYVNTYLVGKSTAKYSGTFDGQGFTITFEKEGLADGNLAPFRFINGATIKNLKTAGMLSTSGQYVAGIVGEAAGNASILNCASSIALTTTYESGDACCAGIIGASNATSTNVTIQNCLFDGTLNAAKGISGIAGYLRAGTHTITNVLFAGTAVYPEGATNLRSIERHGGTVTVTNGYYINKVGSAANGTQATALLLNSGSLAYTLNTGNTETLFWGQGGLNASNVDAYPTLTTDAAKKVVRTKASGTSTNFYVNPGGEIPNAVRLQALGWKLTATSPLMTSIPTDFTTDDVEISRTYGAYKLKVGSTGAATLVLPFSTDDLPEGVKAYDLTFDGTTVTATEVTKITADQPVLINAAAGDYQFNSGLTAWITDYADRTPTNGALTGVYVNPSGNYNPIAYVPADSYVLQQGAKGLGFYKVAADNTIGITSFRAYLTAASSAPMLAVNFAGTTGIKNIYDLPIDNSPIFTLGGQRVSQPAKGLYIVNGKKYIAK